MRGIIGIISRFVHGNFSEHDDKTHTRESIRRIRLVNYISLISIASMMSYVVLYMVIDINLFFPAIFFLPASSLVIVGLIIINNKGFHNLAKILLALLNPVYMGSVSTWIFGPAPGFHTFLFAAAIIPLFLWSVKDLTYLVFFIGFSLSLYIAIEFFPPVFYPLIVLPDYFLNPFRSSTIMITFSATALAIIVYFELSNNQEARLLRQAEELEISQQHRDMVYSIVAHDLRGPFKGLMGITDLMLRQLGDSKDLEEIKYIKTIYNSSNAINNLLDNLLNWSKMQSGNLIIDRKPFNLKDNVDEIKNLLNDALEAKSITFTNKVDPGLLVVADSNMISTVLRNVLSNAIKFTSSGGDVGISATLLENVVEICIYDTGIGIPEDDIEKLFNVQSRLSTPGTNNERGSGLGLKLCKDFIEANNGEIWAESELGKGSKMYFTLPSILN